MTVQDRPTIKFDKGNLIGMLGDAAWHLRQRGRDETAADMRMRVVRSIPDGNNIDEYDGWVAAFIGQYTWIEL